MAETKSCLTNKKVIVRFIRKETQLVNDKRHPLYGGMAENAVKVLTVPQLPTGLLRNPLTKEEQDFLEEYMGLQKDALSIHKKEDNFWTNYKVRLTKSDTPIDLSSPDGYIKYKVLLSNIDKVAESTVALKTRPRASYQFVIIDLDKEAKEATENMTVSMRAIGKLGKILDKIGHLRLVLEIAEGKKLANTTSKEVIQAGVFELASKDPKLFLTIVEDASFELRYFISQCILAKLIKKSGDFYFLAENNQPLADNEDPTINAVIRYLNSPKNQEVKFSLEAKLKTDENKKEVQAKN